MGKNRVNIKAILRDPAQCRELMIDTIIATQAREGITTTRKQAAAAWDKVQIEKAQYSLKQRLDVSPQRPLPVPPGYRDIATAFGEAELEEPVMREILERYHFTKRERRALVKAIVAGYLEGWVRANCERDDLANPILMISAP
jgi:hypothetical protein